MAPPVEYKIVVLGSGAVGKSALTIQLVSNQFVSVYDPTIEDSYRTQVEIDGDPAVLDILDTAGQEEFSSMRDQYMMTGKGFIFVYAINMYRSFDELTAIRQRLYKVKDKNFSFQIPIVICGNKCDLENEREVPTSEGQKLAQDWNCRFLETSALTRNNVELAFFELVRLIRMCEKSAPYKKNALSSLL
eukprot:TRINITY_DN21316_c0_g1_i1.p1 TRINITY_DN21316_c0_g1~~TRINITY_DN21316_c0_g1_i1.p1  ORF type:complete len:189 (+),score=31.30 TRINITY_DN21316_c0_g1_i1:2-568(+)